MDAKRNVEGHYLAVGILEEIDLFLKLVVNLLPTNFKMDWPEHQTKHISQFIYTLCRVALVLGSLFLFRFWEKDR